MIKGIESHICGLLISCNVNLRKMRINMMPFYRCIILVVFYAIRKG